MGVILAALLVPMNVYAVIVLTLSPSPQTISQGQTATYNIGIVGKPNTAITMSVSGVVGSFSSNPVTTDGAGNANVQLVADATTPPTYCPGTYSFTVTASGGGDTQTIGGVLTVNQVGLPLQVLISSDKSSYQTGQPVVISFSVNRPAEGTVTVTGPSGFNSVTYPFTTQTSGTGTVPTFTAGPTGTYTANVQADDYCGGFNNAQTSFSVTPNAYAVTVSASGIPSQYSATLLVDGQPQGQLQGSQTKTLNFPISSTHTIAVDQYVSGATGVRYYCDQTSWSVSSTDSHIFNYQTQYELTITSDPSGVAQVGSGGWFNSGANAQTGQAPQTVPGAAGTQYAFNGWVVDGSPQSGAQITLAMNGPHNATAKYTTQYQLTINSPNGLGNPQGGGYYNAGSTAQFSVTSPQGILIQQVLQQWQGDYTGTSPQGSITMSAPKTVTAVWGTSYTNLYLIAGAVIVILVVGAIAAMRRRGGKEAKPPEPKEEKEEKRGLHLGGSNEE